MSNIQTQLQHLDARIGARMQAILDHQDWFPCRRGCDQCCRQLAHPPELTPGEWARIDRAIAALPDVLRTQIQEKIQALLTQIVQGTTPAAIVCPFLNDREGACHIYEARPIACRTYGFFVARNHNQYCTLIEAELEQRHHPPILWGNASSVQHELAAIDDILIPFAAHFGIHPGN